MKEFVEYIVKALVDHVDAVRISEIYGKRNIILEVRCHKNDIGRVIGKNGKIIGAVRLLLNSLAAKRGRKATLELVE